MKALLIIAHGSRRQASNDEVVQLVQRISADLAQEYSMIQACFLELAAPLIPDAINQCIRNGATEITILPYFLSAGRHVEQDIPAAISLANEKHHDITISILPHIGASGQMPEMIFHSLAHPPIRNIIRLSSY